jgi:hypothetical protein
MMIAHVAAILMPLLPYAKGYAKLEGYTIIFLYHE